MPRIVVMADMTGGGEDRRVMFTERVSLRDFESSHFQGQLVERLGWAVGDAHEVEQGRDAHEEHDVPETSVPENRDELPQRKRRPKPHLASQPASIA